MIETKSGVKIEFQKLDEWAIQVKVSVPHTKGDKVVASPVIALSSLKDEIAMLENAKPPEEDEQ